ncbi:MAG: MBL fold metallo-hydrolase [Rhodospirillaceae bacterium]|nr:MBL fold metallo-hydrolase [Rhodospirillaceae bacterium]
MPKITKTKVTTGVIWVEVPEAGMSILCGCPEDAVKHLMQRGFIETTEKDGVQFETGPNAILLSDLPIQNGAFCNLSEFPVLQMLYRQGMLLPNHPNNTGMRPLLLGSEGQVKAQMQYIYRGNYGLISKAEIMAAGMSAESAELIMDMKSKFAFGNIRATEELLDSHIVDAAPREIRNGVMICRIGTNIFEFTYEDEIIIVDLNLPQGQKYRSPYPLGFQNISREYFAVIHSGQGDGWDVNRPSMSSILVYQGKIYLIDAGPNVEYSLTALGIGINEIEGIFHTHCHDDHFSGLTTLMRADHRIKYFATPVVRASVFKKLAALMSKDESLISSYFDVFDLDFDTWNDIEGLEVRPFLSPHPVETSVLSFRTFWEGRYLTYSHLADIASFKVMRDMIDAVPAENSFDQSRFEAVRQEYLAKVDLKKIDVGGGMIHGAAEDLLEDTSDKIILSHQSEALTSS